MNTVSEGLQTTAAKFGRVTLQLTKFCNLNCSYCYCNPITRGEVEGLQLEPLLEFIKRINNAGCSSVVLTGGEPLIHPHFAEVVAELRRLNITIALETNGFLLDDNTLDLLNGTKTHIALTLESVDPKVHDEIRKRTGSWKAAVDALSRSRSFSSLTSQITFNLTARTVDEIGAACTLGTELGVSRIKFNPIYKIGPRGNPDNTRLYLSPTTLFDATQRWSEFLAQDFPFDVLLAVPPALIPANVPIRKSMCMGCELSALIGVLHDGTIRPCHNFMYSTAHIFGSIYAQYDLNEIRARISSLPGTDPFVLKGICSDCLFLSTCKGFCRAQAQNNFGRTDEPNWLCQVLADSGLFPSELRISKISTLFPDGVAGTSRSPFVILQQ